MHELSVTLSILDVAEESARSNNAKVVHEIELDIGELSGIDFNSLEFAISNAPKSEMMKDVNFVINRIDAIAKCNDCSCEFETGDYYTPCPQCNSFNSDIIQGKELKIKSIKID